MDEVSDLSTHCSPCIDNAKRLGLILYNPVVIPRATEEAGIIKRAFQEAGFEAATILWKNKEELFSAINEDLIQEEVDNSSILICCIMVRGNSGAVLDSEGKPLTVNAIIHHLRSKLPTNLTLVRKKHQNIT